MEGLSVDGEWYVVDGWVRGGMRGVGDGYLIPPTPYPHTPHPLYSLHTHTHISPCDHHTTHTHCDTYTHILSTTHVYMLTNSH